VTQQIPHRAASPGLARFAWGVLGFNLLVILWGAYVRASGSGAGCGNHWPLCNGEVVPRVPQVQTFVELTHRTTSGIALLLVLGMAIWTFRGTAKGHPARKGAGYSVFFILMEAALGAGLVLFELVAHNASLTRAFSMSAHLVNTFFLLAALSLTAWWLSGGERLRLRGQGGAVPLLAGGILLTILLGVTGGIAALGDTLFPSGSLAEGVAQDFVPTANALVRLRVIHPIVAIVAGLYITIAAGLVANWRQGPEHARTRTFAKILGGLFLVQLGMGVINLSLMAPIWTQILHLLLADAVWIALVLLGASATADIAEPVPFGATGSSISPAGSEALSAAAR
jgi:heme A synthase